MQGRCKGCGKYEKCSCDLWPNRLAISDIACVVTFLRNSLELKKALSVETILLSLAAESLLYIKSKLLSKAHCASLPTSRSQTLIPILQALLPHKEGLAYQLVLKARHCNPRVLFNVLKANKCPWLYSVLVLYNYKYYAARYPQIHAESVCVNLWLESVAFLSGPTSLGPQIEQMRDDDIAMLISRMLVIEYSVDEKISSLGHSNLSTLPGGTRFMRCIHLGNKLPLPLLKLVLCHELVHVALWLRQPYANTGIHSHEEVFCHAAMLLYANRFLEKSPEAQKILHYRAHVCLKDARMRNEKLFEVISHKLSSKCTDQAIAIFLESCGT